MSTVRTLVVFLFTTFCTAGASEAHLRAHLEFLASDAMRGRKSGTHDELVTATYIASQMRMIGLQPAGDTAADGSRSYLQTIPFDKTPFEQPLKLQVGAEESRAELVHGRDLAFMMLGRAEFSGPLQFASANADFKPQPGAVVFIPASFRDGGMKAYRDKISLTLMSGATAVLTEYHPDSDSFFQMAALRDPELSQIPVNVVLLGQSGTEKIKAMAEGTPVSFKGNVLPKRKAATYNVAGYFPGSSPDAEAVVLACHMDHLGTVAGQLEGDHIYNGADDDASGVAAMLETARLLQGADHKRALYLIAFGSEETGGMGSTHASENPPVPLERMAAFIEFEMVGRPDPNIGAHPLWMAGAERSTLFDLLNEAGANLAADPYPEEMYFTRSDNIVFAEKGVVAHSVSTFSGHEDYHQVSDDISLINFKHMVGVVNAMAGPIKSLLNSDKKPQWKPGGKPGAGMRAGRSKAGPPPKDAPQGGEHHPQTPHHH